jgi:hypothetical protein
LYLKDKMANFGKSRFHQHSATIASAIHEDHENATPWSNESFIDFDRQNRKSIPRPVNEWITVHLHAAAPPGQDSHLMLFV